jgi:tetratricopeptide (TPR) repeat protein
VRKALGDLKPIVSVVELQRRILTGVEADAVVLAMEFSHILGDRDQYREYANLLWERTPLPINYAYAVTRGVIPPNPELPSRLRRERGESFEAKRLATFIEGTLLNKTAEAVKEAELLVAEFRSREQQEQLAHLLMELSTHLPSSERSTVERRAAELLGPDSRFTRLRMLESLVKEGKFDEAEGLLGTTADKDEPVGLELLAAIRTGQGRNDEAVDLLIRATNQFPEPGVLRKAAHLAESSGRTVDAIKLLRRVVRAEPEDGPARFRLARLHMERGEYEQAAALYHLLRKQHPTEPAFGVNEAISLALAMRPNDSLKVYDELCSAENPPVEAVVGRAALLKGMNRAEEGFRSLEPYRNRFWHHAVYLTAYMDLGYASKRESEAHEGFLRLFQLQKEGAIEKVLHEANINDLIGLMRQNAENEEHLNAAILKGHFPWLLAAQMMNLTSIVGFRTRTSPVRWLLEDPPQWARHALYATNGFVVTGSDTNRKWVEPIRCPELGQKVVVDLSALIILWRLGLLSKAAEYFGECLYPASYRESALSDRSRLVPHQPSQPEAAKGVLAAVTTKRLTLAEEVEGLPFVHEHCPEPQASEQRVYGFTDLIPPLKASGLVPDAKLDELAGLAHRPTGAGDGRPTLSFGGAVRIDHTSLETLEKHGLLAPVASTLKVHIMPDDVSALEEKIASWEERTRLWEWHTELWDAVKAESRLTPQNHHMPAEFLAAKSRKQSEEGDDDSWLPLHAVFLAGETNLPLLVDDRCCQMFVHNDRRTATVAFGTDSLVAGLLEAKLITVDEAADAYLKLTGWRYRFLVIPPVVLVALAKRYTATPPGQPLRHVARYVQDCMRDPGLFGGLEQTAPPVSMAQKLFLAWATALTEFVLIVWEDASIPPTLAHSLTEWALTECVPSAPMTSVGLSWVLEQQLPRMLLSQAFIRAATSRDPERANAALLKIAGVLGVDGRDYLETLAEVADAF